MWVLTDIFINARNYLKSRQIPSNVDLTTISGILHVLSGWTILTSRGLGLNLWRILNIGFILIFGRIILVQASHDLQDEISHGMHLRILVSAIHLKLSITT